MEDKRKDLMVAGLYLGDVTLVLAATAMELPSYVEGFELERVIPDAGGLEPARREIDSLMGGSDGTGGIPPELLRKILDRAIETGRFLSASRCLDLLGGRDEFIERLLADAAGKLKAGDIAGSARCICIASNLESETGFPLFQYSGPDLHAGCETAPEGCLTRAVEEEAVTRAMAYLLEGEKVRAFTGALGAAERKDLLPHIALDRDPDLREFYAAFAKAQETLGRIEREDLETLKTDIMRAAAIASGLEKYLRSASPSGDGAAALERARRMASGFVKDFEGVEALLENLQLKRLKRRIGNMLESESELSAAGEAVESGGTSSPLSQAIALVAEFRDGGAIERIDGIEAALVGLQVGLLGRPVHSQEHWQYLRELAFKYPVSPIMCCIRKLDDRYMVVPRWDGNVTAILRDFLEAA